MNTSQHKIKRNHRGVSKKAIALRMLPEEHELIQRISTITSRSMAAVAHDACSRGLPSIAKEAGVWTD